MFKATVITALVITCGFFMWGLWLATTYLVSLDAKLKDAIMYLGSRKTYLFAKDMTYLSIKDLARCTFVLRD